MQLQSADTPQFVRYPLHIFSKANASRCFLRRPFWQQLEFLQWLSLQQFRTVEDVAQVLGYNLFDAHEIVADSHDCVGRPVSVQGLASDGGTSSVRTCASIDG